MKIFISYAHVDEAPVRELVEILRAGGHDPWFDHCLVAGRTWENQLLDAIKVADRFLYTLTPESSVSQWCQWEFTQAIHAKKPIIPVKMLSNIVFIGVLDILNRIQYVDFCHGSTPEAVARLLNGVQNAECISPKSVPKLSPPDTKPERLIEEKGSNQGLVGEFYEEAKALYKNKQYDETREKLEDCLNIEANHANARKLMILVEQKIGKLKESTPVRKPEKPKPMAVKITPPPQKNGPPVASKVLRIEDILPVPIEWVEIPAGQDVRDINPFRNEIPAFLITRAPISDVQYRVFADAQDGYRIPRWWEYSDAAIHWRNEHPRVPKVDASFLGHVPRTMVCWYEAIAFCRWLSEKMGQQILLPTLPQWRKAQRLQPPRLDLTAFQYPKIKLSDYNANKFPLFEIDAELFKIWGLTKNELSRNSNLSGNAPRLILDVDRPLITRCETADPAKQDAKIGFQIVRSP